MRLESVVKEVDWSENYYYRGEINNLWYRHGRLDREENIFHVDKERIKKMLLNEAEQRLVTACSFFDENVLVSMVEELPSKIEFTDNEEFVLDKEGPIPVLRTKAEMEYRKKERSRFSLSVSLGGNDDEEDELTPEATDIHYDDLGGLDDEIRMLKESVEIPFKYPEVFEHLGISAYKGILFYGPPGTGKTLLAKAVANESDMNFYTVNGPEIFDKYFGESERK